MFNLKVSEDELKMMFKMLDDKLKSGGLEVLSEVVAIHNALATAEKLTEDEEKK